LDLSRVHQKLAEANFFLDRLREQEQRFVGDKQPFDYYLSAFLNATTAARNGFKVRQDRARNDRIKAWCEDWESSLSPDEKQLYRFMREDRVAEHHHGGSARERGQEGVGFGFGEHRLPEGGTIYVSGIPAPLGGDAGPPVTAYRPTYTFTIAGSERKVTDACGAYLALLKRMVAEFEAVDR